MSPATDTSFHPVSSGDRAAIDALRTATAAMKGTMTGIGARPTFDAIMDRVPAPDGVTYARDVLGGVTGWWCHPPGAHPDTALLHLHGGWFNWGSAKAFRHFVGNLALRSGVSAFVPDYRLAPEHPFPAAIEDAEAVYEGLVASGWRHIAITGDSAGGNLALLLLTLLSSGERGSQVVPIAGVVVSPVTDLTLSGESWTARAERDPYFTRSQATTLVASYMGGSPNESAAASPLYGEFGSLPPFAIHVGSEEVLFDDSLRLFERARGQGADVTLDVWEGMPHGFLANVDRFDAARHALTSIGDFLSAHLTEAKR